MSSGALELVEPVRLRRGRRAEVHRLHDVGAVQAVVDVRAHRAELVGGELALVEPEPLLAEEHRAGRVAAHAERDHGEQRREQQQHQRRAGDVDRALDQPRRAAHARRRQADQRQALDGVHAHARADDLEQPRHQVELDVELAQRVDQLQRLLVRLVREGDHDALDVERPDDLRQRLGRAEQRHVLELRAAHLGLPVDEADQVDAVLGMLQQLAGRRAGRRRRRPRSPCSAGRRRCAGRCCARRRGRPRPARRPGPRTGSCARRRISAAPVSHEATNTSQAPSVTRCSTPASSSTVECSVRSSSWS